MNSIAVTVSLLIRLIPFLLVVNVVRAAERDIVRTFPVLPGCTVSIDSYRGAITVTEADTEQVRVAIHLDIGSDNDRQTEQMLAGLELDVHANGPVISI